MKFDARKLQAAWPKAAVSALNKTGTTVRRRALQLLSSDLGVRQAELGRLVVLKRASRGKLVATVEARGAARLSLSRHKPRQTRKGLTYQGRRGEGRKLVPGGFLITTPEGGILPVKRYGARRVMTKGRYKGQMRQPLVKLHSVSINHAFVQERIMRAMRDTGQDRFHKLWPNEIRFYLRKAGVSDAG